MPKWLTDLFPDLSKNLTPNYVAFLALAGFSILGFPYLLIREKQYALAFLSFIVGLIVFSLLLYVIRSLERSEGTSKELRKLVEQNLKGQADYWSRPMIQLPLPSNYRDRVLNVMDGAIDAAHLCIHAFDPNFNKENIRANIFLPNNAGIRDGDVCNLTIPKFNETHDDLSSFAQRNMMKRDEVVSLRFRPNDGATGKVYVEWRPVGVLTNPDWLDSLAGEMPEGTKRWIYVRIDEPLSRVTTDPSTQFNMTERHEIIVDKDLALIISMPISAKTNLGPECLGVMNIDCRFLRADAYQLYKIYTQVAPFAQRMGEVLTDLLSDRVAIVKFKN
jgi:hypothetical protein